MRYRRWIVLSTIVIYVLTLALAVMWLLKVREVDVRVTETSSGSTVYEECNEKLEKMLLGRKLFSVSADEIVTELEKDPYVTVKKVKRRFPDAVEVEIEERAECFAVKNEELYYILDRDYNLLDKRTTLEKEGGAGKILPVEVKNVKLGFAAFRVGKPITYDETGMFGYAVRLFRSLDDLNFLKSITVYGSGGEKEERIYLNTETGVSLEFRFAVPRGLSSSSKGEIAAARNTLCDKIGEVKAAYDAFTEKQKSEGYYLVYMTDDAFSVRTEYTVRAES